MNIKPIPLKLLTDNIIYYERLDTERENEFKDGITINNCLTQLGINKEYDINGELVIATGRIYIDAKHSKPLIHFKQSDMIEYNKNKYYIVSIMQHKAFGELHHIALDVK